MKTERIAIAGLIVCFGAFLAFYFFRKTVKQGEEKNLDELLGIKSNVTSTAPVAVPPQSVKEKVANGAVKELMTLTDAEFKKYASWIDRIEQITIDLKKKGSQIATDELAYNCKTLKGLTDMNLYKVVNYWQSLRSRKIYSLQNFSYPVIDKESSVSGLLSRLKSMKF